MSKGKILVLGIVCLSFLLSGCYYSTCMREMRAAENSLAQLKAAGGEKLVPYEYTAAEKYLEISGLELAEPDYKWAAQLAGRSKAASQAGLAEIQKKK